MLMIMLQKMSIYVFFKHLVKDFSWSLVLLILIWLELIVIVSAVIKPGYLDFDNLPDTNFTCIGKVIGGYYADVETSCQMFHVCTIGPSDEPMDIRFLCLNGTVFDQETRVCERVEEVDCSKTERFYNLNLELYGNVQENPNENIIKQSPSATSTTSTTTSTTTSSTTTINTTTHRPYFSTTAHSYLETSLDIDSMFAKINKFFKPRKETHSYRTTISPSVETVSSSSNPTTGSRSDSAFFYGLVSSTASTKDIEKPISYQNQNFYKPIYYVSSTTTDHTPNTNRIIPSSSPAPFSRQTTGSSRSSLFEHTTPFRFFDPIRRLPMKRNEPPRIIVNVDATVRDSNGRQLNYTIGTIVPSGGGVPSTGLEDYNNNGHSLSSFGSNFNNDHYDDTPFYYDVPKIRPKVQSRRFRRKLFYYDDYVDDNYESSSTYATVE